MIGIFSAVRTHLVIVLLALCFVLTGCSAPASTVRLGDPEVGSLGGPSSACERADWFELVPTRSYTRQSSSDGAWTRTVQERVGGYSVYRHGSDAPEDLRDMLPRMGEPELAQSHLSRMGSAARRGERSNRLMRWGVSVTGGGVGAYLLGAPIDVGVIGALSGLGLAVASLLTDPSEDERAYAFPRIYTLSPSEVNIDAARRGIDRMNRETRERCAEAAQSKP
jgi:hypothetical protein